MSEGEAELDMDGALLRGAQAAVLSTIETLR